MGGLDQQVDNVVREVSEDREVFGHSGLPHIRQRVVGVHEDEVILAGVVSELEEVLAVYSQVVPCAIQLAIVERE